MIEGRDDAFQHYELLLRMEDEAGNVVPPGAFLPAVERYDLSGKLDRWVIDRTFEWLTTQPKHLEQLYLCAINLSGHSLTDETFQEFVIRRSQDADVPPQVRCGSLLETGEVRRPSPQANLASFCRQWTEGR